MNDLQRKMMAAAEEIMMKEKEKEGDAKEKGFRKRVFEAIVALTDAVDEATMLSHLPYLDRSSWSEVAEERFLAQICALPSCDVEVKREKKPKGEPMYKIDRVEGKIYESGHANRQGFCSRVCYDRFENVREQLAHEPLWTTGKPKDGPFSLPSSLPSRVHRRSTDGGEERKIEIVKDSLLVSKLDSLFIAERDGQSSDEEKEEGREEDGMEMKTEDNDFVSSIHRYCTMSTGGMKKEDEKMDVEEKKKKSEKRDKKSEDEKLRAIREKIKNRQVAPKRKAILTEAKPLTSEQLRQEEREQAKREKPSSASVPQEPSNGMTAEELEGLPEETVPFTNHWEIPAKLFVGWVNKRTTDVVRMGGRRAVNEVDRLLRKFYAGDKADAIENDDVPLPMVDGCDVRKRRIDIMLTSIKPTYSSLESHLNVRSSRLADIHSIVASLTLDSHSITGWSKREIRVITLGLWRIVCMLSDELESDFFPNGTLSNEMRSLLELWQLEENIYCRLVKMIEGRIAMFEPPKMVGAP